jgi:glucan endo-1,3-beta-D-glucosidase
MPSTSSFRLVDVPIPSSVPIDLRGAFEAPHLIVPIDKANPTRVVENSYIAKLSLAFSTVFVFDVCPEYQGKLCNLVFFMPPAFKFQDLSPVIMRSPGGISVSRLSDGVAVSDINASHVGISVLLSVVTSIQPNNQYAIVSMPCEAGQRVAYQVDSVGGLNMDFFQMTSPALGLFMIPE